MFWVNLSLSSIVILPWPTNTSKCSFQVVYSWASVPSILKYSAIVGFNFLSSFIAFFFKSLFSEL